MSGKNVVNLVITALSTLGSLIMMGSFIMSPHLRKLRHQLIFGLAVSDLIGAATVLGQNASILAGRAIGDESAGCQASAFLYQSSGIASAAWTLSIALVTYTVLVHPLSRPALALESRWTLPVLWAGIWGVSILDALFGQVFLPVLDYNGICWYPKGLYSELALFLPRAVVFALVIFTYLRLYFFFRKNDKFAKQMDDFAAQASNDNRRDAVDMPVYPMTEKTVLESVRQRMSLSSLTGSRRGSASTAVPPAQSATAPTEGYSHGTRASVSTTGRKDSKTSDTTLVDSVLSSPMQAFKTKKVDEEDEDEDELVSDTASPELDPAGSPVLWRTVDWSFANHPTRARSAGMESRSPGHHMAQSPHSPLSPGADLPRSPEASRKYGDVEKSGQPSGLGIPFPVPEEHQLQTHGFCFDDSSDAGTDSTPKRRPTQPVPQAPPKVPRPPRKPKRLSQFFPTQVWAQRRTSAEEAQLSSLPSLPPRGDLAPHPHEPKRRLTPHEMNRRISMLMMLYPLAYLVLFSLSVARLILDLVTNSERKVIEGFDNLSRWLVLAQGTIDVLIYAFVEWRVRNH